MKGAPEINNENRWFLFSPRRFDYRGIIPDRNGIVTLSDRKTIDKR